MRRRGKGLTKNKAPLSTSNSTSSGKGRLTSWTRGPRTTSLKDRGKNAPSRPKPTAPRLVRWRCPSPRLVSTSSRCRPKNVRRSLKPSRRKGCKRLERKRRAKMKCLREESPKRSRSLTHRSLSRSDSSFKWQSRRHTGKLNAWRWRSNYGNRTRSESRQGTYSTSRKSSGGVRLRGRRSNQSTNLRSKYFLTTL